MGSESLQHKLDRVRRPRVQITYDVETGGAMQKVELPFVVGVMADLSGKPKEALKPLKDRKVADGRVVKAVAGFDATLSAPKSRSKRSIIDADSAAPPTQAYCRSSSWGSISGCSSR